MPELTAEELRQAKKALGLESHPGYDPLVSLTQAASYLEMSPDKLSLLARTRQIASVRTSQKRGSPVRFRLSVLNAWVKSHEIKALRSVG